jgi:hypothetical protein
VTASPKPTPSTRSRRPVGRTVERFTGRKCINSPEMPTSVMRGSASTAAVPNPVSAGALSQDRLRHLTRMP